MPYTRGIPVNRRRKPAKAAPPAPVDTYRQGDQAEKVVERAYDDAVERSNGVLWQWRDNDPRRNEAGWTDRVIIGPRGVFFRELKSDTGGLTEKQAVVGRRLLAAGADYAVRTPEDVRRGIVINEMNWLARGAPDSPAYLRDGLAKALYLMSVVQDVPKAELHWRAGSRIVDKAPWLLSADEVLRTVLGLLPRDEEQVADWLRAHRLGAAANPDAVLGALRTDLERAIGGQGNVDGH